MLGEILLAGTAVHIILMLALVIGGYAAGENISWLLGLPLMIGGLLCFQLGGKKGAAWRDRQEGLLMLIGLGCGAFVLLHAIFN
jgi:hypothetical protein